MADDEQPRVAEIVQRPWGHFLVLARGPRHVVETLLVHGHQRLSLQRHARRTEVWVLVAGQARVSVGGVKQDLVPGLPVRVPCGAEHRIENPGFTPATIIETQYGDPDEADIERLADDYGRAGAAQGVAEAELAPGLIRVRDRWPVAKCDAATWKRIAALAGTGKAADEAEAMALARACTLEHPKRRADHFGAVAGRAPRRAFLRVQAAAEGEIRGALADAADRLGAYLARQEDGGVIPPGRLGAVRARLKEENSAAYAAIRAAFLGLVRTAAKRGLQRAMTSADAVQQALAGAQEEALEHLVQAHLEEVDPLKQRLTYSASSPVFQRLFKGALRKTMQAGLFGDDGLSGRVWDLRDGNLERLKRLVGGGIARGASAAEVSRDVRSLLVQPKTLRGRALADTAPGVGVYRSAYKNAVRLTRTESNRAFAMGDVLFAEEKGWNVIWQVSTGHREEDECDRLHGKEMSPQEFSDLYPLHPQDLCYSIVAVPKFPEDVRPTDLPEA